MFATIAETSLELTKGFDDMTVSLNKTTGQGTRFEAELISTERTLRQHGITTAELGEAFGSLTTTFNSITDASAAQRQELIQGGAILDKFGISSDSTSKNLGIMTAAMDMSATTAMKTQIAMYSFAKGAGLETNKFFADFEAHQGTMARFGDQSSHVFKELAFAAQKSNMEVSQLLNIIDQFDRFDTAAESVGKMNALLGGPFLNSLEMVTSTDPIDRLKMLQDSLSDAGKDFQSMSYYEKQAIADAMGLKDVGELALLMGGQFEHLAGGAELTQQEYEDLAKQSAEYNTIQEELRQTMQAFAVSMKPVLDMIKGFLNFIQKIPDPVKKFIGIAFLGIGAFIMFLKVAKAFLAGGAVLQGIYAAATGASAVAQTVQTAATSAAAPVMGAAIPVMVAFGAAALKLGLAVGIAALGLAGLVYALSFINPGQILAGAGAIAVMGIVLGVIVGVLMSLVAGPQAGILGLAILALYGIVGAFVLASLGASVFAASIALVAASVASIFTAMQGVTDSLAQLSGEQFMAAAMGIASMGAAIRALPVVKTVMLKTVFDSAAAFQTSATIAAADYQRPRPNKVCSN